MPFLDGKIGAGLAFSGLAGLANVYPKYDAYLKSIAKPNLTEALAGLRDGSECILQAEMKLAYKSFLGSVTVADPYSSPISKEVLAENFLGKGQAPITDFPVYLTHSQTDMVVKYGPVLTYYQSQCSKGAKIVFSSPAMGTHGFVVSSLGGLGSRLY